jgi:probable F420-dependent oxidoreductase
MDFGVGYFPTHDGVSPGDLAQMVEEHGFESLFFAEHTHIPASRESPWVGDRELPRKYFHMHDLFVALTHAAAATTRLRIGSAICLVIERDPIVTAKEVASVDQLSGGRLEFGVGAGWNREEMQNHGTDPRKRMAIMRERVEAMKAIWTEDEASYSGEHVSFERIWSWPKPVQRPYPPVIVGGAGPTVLDRVAAFGDGWFPQYRGGDEVFDRIREMHARADRPLVAYLIGAPADPAVIEQAQQAGVRRVIRWLSSGPRSRVEASMEKWEGVIAQFTGG